MTNLPNIGKSYEVPIIFGGLNRTNNYKIGQALVAEGVDSAALPHLRGIGYWQGSNLSDVSISTGGKTVDMLTTENQLLIVSNPENSQEVSKFLNKKRWFISNEALVSRWNTIVATTITTDYDDLASNTDVAEIQALIDSIRNQELQTQDDYDTSAQTDLLFRLEALVTGSGANEKLVVWGSPELDEAYNRYELMDGSEVIYTLDQDRAVKTYNSDAYGSSYFYKDAENIMPFGTRMMNTRKQYAKIGDWLYIFPDKIMLNLLTAEIKDMEAKLQNVDGTNVTVATDGTITFASSNISPSFYYKPGDYVRIERGLMGEGENHFKVISAGINSIKLDSNFAAYYDEPETVSVHVLLKKEIPSFDSICASNNRLWGVDTETNTIYASALGKPCEFFCFEGTDADSYAAAVGSEGVFTACVAYGGDILCFKENLMHRVSGDFPSNYAISTYSIPGVERGAARTCVVHNEILYYKGRSAVYAYSGGLPVNISQPLGEFKDPKVIVSASTDASETRGAGVIGFMWRGKYVLIVHSYTHRTRPTGQNYINDKIYTIYYYDIERNTWTHSWIANEHSYAVFDDRFISRSGGTLAAYPLEELETNAIDKPFDITFCPIDAETTDKKRLKRLNFFQSGTSRDLTNVYVNGTKIGEAKGEGVFTFPINVSSRSCTIRLEHDDGAGEIADITLTYLEGSNRY